MAQGTPASDMGAGDVRGPRWPYGNTPPRPLETRGAGNFRAQLGDPFPEPAPVKLSAVHEELGYLEVTLTELECDATELENRLGSVLMVADSVPENGCAMLAQADSERNLAAAIRIARTRAGVVRDTLRSITDRLEV